MSLRAIFKKHSHIICYGFFGVLTTLANIAVYWLMAHVLKLEILPSTIIAWIVAVLFAYLTNRTWVFHSGAQNGQAIIREAASFFLCRLSTGVVDWGLMLVCIEILNWNDLITKLIANVIVIILNYVFSKVIVFRRR